MGLLGKFDLSTDLTKFFLGGTIILMIFGILLTWVSPKGRSKRRGGKVDDRTVNFEGDLID